MPNECWALELAQGTCDLVIWDVDCRMDPVDVTLWIVVDIVFDYWPWDVVQDGLVDGKGNAAVVPSGQDIECVIEALALVVLESINRKVEDNE